MSYQDGIVKQTEFFTTAELAQKLKMNVQVVTRKVQAGEIQAYKIGKEWRIPEQAVFAWLEKRTNQPTSQPVSPMTPSGPFHQSGQQTGKDFGDVESIANSRGSAGTDTGTNSITNDNSLPVRSANLTKNSARVVSVEIPIAQVRHAGSDSEISATGNSNGTGGTRRFLLEYILAQFIPHKSYLEHEVDLIIRRHGQDAESVKEEMLAARMLNAALGKFTRRLDYQLSTSA